MKKAAIMALVLALTVGQAQGGVPWRTIRSLGEIEGQIREAVVGTEAREITFVPRVKEPEKPVKAAAKVVQEQEYYIYDCFGNAYTQDEAEELFEEILDGVIEPWMDYDEAVEEVQAELEALGFDPDDFDEWY